MLCTSRKSGEAATQNDKKKTWWQIVYRENLHLFMNTGAAEKSLLIIIAKFERILYMYWVHEPCLARKTYDDNRTARACSSSKFDTDPRDLLLDLERGRGK